MRYFRYSRLQSSLRLAMSSTRLEEEKKNEIFFLRTISSRISPYHNDLLLLFTLLPSVVTLFSQRLERNIHRVMRKNWCFRFGAEVSMLIFLSSEWFFQFSFGSVSISRRVECQKCVNWLWITALSSDIKLFCELISSGLFLGAIQALPLMRWHNEIVELLPEKCRILPGLLCSRVT